MVLLKILEVLDSICICLMTISKFHPTFSRFRTMFVRGYEFEGDFVYLVMFTHPQVLMRVANRELSDYFMGFGIRFNDEDLKAIIAVSPSPNL